MATKPNKFVEVEDSRAEGWKPREGESIEGTYLGSTTVDGGAGEPFKSFRVRDAEGKIWGVSGATIEERMMRVPHGAMVRITFKGTQKSKRGSDMKLFAVQVAEGTRLHEIGANAAE